MKCYVLFICLALLHLEFVICKGSTKQAKAEYSLRRWDNTTIPLTETALIRAGNYWFGTQLAIGKESKIMPSVLKDGAAPRTPAAVATPFAIDIDTVSNRQFDEFVRQTGYITEAEKFGWSFVLDFLAPDEIIAEVDEKGEDGGMGRVQDARHWMGAKQANWRYPLGQLAGRSLIWNKKNKKKKTKSKPPALSIYELELLDHPVTHVSYQDAIDYCSWTSTEQTVVANAPASTTLGSNGDLINNEGEKPKEAIGWILGIGRLPTEIEWEYVARGGYVNNTYPWGTDDFRPNQFNIWSPGHGFPPAGYGHDTSDMSEKEKIKKSKDKNKDNSDAEQPDGYRGTSPVLSYAPNRYGVYQMLGNIWEWCMYEEDVPALRGIPKKKKTKKTKKQQKEDSERRPLRGGSFIDSFDGSFNHVVMTSTRQWNTLDSTASNSGFRCVYPVTEEFAADEE